LTRLRPWRPVELADVLDFNPGKLVERHLAEMLAEGLLERTHPENPTHPAQAYRAARVAGNSTGTHQAEDDTTESTDG
jgi:ATP-dependent DNA helicase RecG